VLACGLFAQWAIAADGRALVASGEV